MTTQTPSNFFFITQQRIKKKQLCQTHEHKDLTKIMDTKQKNVKREPP